VPTQANTGQHRPPHSHISIGGFERGLLLQNCSATSFIIHVSKAARWSWEMRPCMKTRPPPAHQLYRQLPSPNAPLVSISNVRPRGCSHALANRPSQGQLVRKPSSHIVMWIAALKHPAGHKAPKQAILHHICPAMVLCWCSAGALLLPCCCPACCPAAALLLPCCLLPKTAVLNNTPSGI
jgi:hypothetical protein